MTVDFIQAPPSVTTLTYINHCGNKPKLPETLPASLADCLSSSDYTELFLKPVKEAAERYKIRGENAAAWITFACFLVMILIPSLVLAMTMDDDIFGICLILFLITALLFFFFPVLFAARDSDFKLLYIKMESICVDISDSLAHKGVIVRSRAVDSSNMAQIVFDFIRTAPSASKSFVADQGSTTTVSE